MQAVGQAAAFHHAPGKFINQHDLIVANDIILVPLKQLMRPQRLIDVMHQRGAFRIIKRGVLVQIPGRAQFTLGEFIAFVSQRNGLGFFVDLVMFFGQAGDEFVDLGIEIGFVIGRAGNDQGGPGLVDQDRIHLIDNRKMMIPLRHLVQL